MAKTKTATYEIISKEDMAFCKVWQNAESLQEVAEKYPQEDDDEDFSKARRSAGIRAGQMRKIGIYLKRFQTVQSSASTRDINEDEALAFMKELGISPEAQEAEKERLDRERLKRVKAK